MLDLRVYRLSLVLGLFAVVVLMFSVASRPDPLTSDVATNGFDGGAAARIAGRVIKEAPDREPGSADDGRAADFVGQQLAAIDGAQVSEHPFKGTYNGDDVEMRNVVAVLPGATSAKIVIAAPRDCGGGVCAASSAASTGALVELARALGAAMHQKTIELVSLDGSTAGAAGAKELAAELSTEPARAVIVLYQPGAKVTRGSPVIPFSEGAQSTSAQLTESAAKSVESERGIPGSPPDGTLSSLLRLAVPAGTGDQGPLIGAGTDAVSLASAGDLPLPEGADGRSSLDSGTLAGVGRSALNLYFSLDASNEPLEHGPGTYVPLAGKLIPGWALSLLALALLLPVGVAGADACIRSGRRGQPVLLALLWVLVRAGCFFAPVLAAYLLAFISIIPSPSWPFDPAHLTVGLGEAVVLGLLVAILATALHISRRAPLPAGAEEAASPAICLLLFAGGFGVWLANPFLALVLVPTVHLWMFAALPELRGRPAVVGPAAVGGLILPSVAILALGDRLDSGAALPWHLVLLFTGGHFSALATVPICLLAGCLMALLTIAATRPAPPKVVRRRARTRGPGGYAGPGALGGTDSALPGR